MRRFAISDIHGCAKTFKALLERIAFTPEDELYLLGDYIDRGPDIKSVVDHIRNLQRDGYTVHCLRGNHEEMFLDSLMNATDYRMWRSNGGWEMMESFDCNRDIQKIPEEYICFFTDLPFYLEVDEYILVHGGLNFFESDPFQDEHSMVWARHWQKDTDYDWLKDRIILHGHTAMKQDLIKDHYKKLAKRQVLGVDCGCVYTHFSMGYLCAFDMTNRKILFQPNVDR